MELTVQIQVAYKAQTTANPIVAVIESLIDWNLHSAEKITEVRSRHWKVSDAKGVETMLRVRDHVSFGGRNFANRPNDVELIIDLDGPFANFTGLDVMWQRILCKTRVKKLP